MPGEWTGHWALKILPEMFGQDGGDTGEDTTSSAKSILTDGFLSPGKQRQFTYSHPQKFFLRHDLYGPFLLQETYFDIKID